MVRVSTAAAALGMQRARAAAGLGCKTCDQAFGTRKRLLKHLKKTGHVATGPSSRGPVLCILPLQQGGCFSAGGLQRLRESKGSESDNGLDELPQGASRKRRKTSRAR